MANELISIERLADYNNNIMRDANVLKRNTAYTLNQVVNKGKVFLKCMTAGTTNTTTLNLSSAAVGSTLTDGTVTWFVLSVTGIPQSDGGSGIENWQSGTSYSSGDLVIKDYVLYQAVTTTSTTWVDSEWNPIGTNFNTTSAYTQKIVTNVVAPYEMLMQTGDSNYCKPPVNILKKVGGESGTTLTLENYNNTSAYTGTNDFLKIENGKANLYNYKEYPFIAQTLDTIDIGVSDEINFNEFSGSYEYIVDSNTLLLLHFNTDLTTDEANNNITLLGNPTITTSSKYGSGAISTSNDNGLNVEYDSKFDFGTEDFTIDFWWQIPAGVTPAPSGYATVLGRDIHDNMFVAIGPSKMYIWRGYIAPNDTEISWSGFPVDGLYHHYAIVRDNGVIKCFLDGHLEGSAANTFSYSMQNTDFDLFTSWDGDSSYSHSLNGNVDEFRISNIARWTSDFTPSSGHYNIKSLEVV